MFGADGEGENIEEEITRISKSADKDTGYWYNSNKWRDKSCVFGIFDVLPTEAAALEEARSEQKAAKTQQKQRRKKRDRYRDDGSRYIKKARSGISDEESRVETKNKVWKDVKERARSARNTESETSKPWEYTGPASSTTTPKQKLVSRAGKHKDAYYLDSGASIHILFNRETLGDIEPLEEAK